jgi:hypothetical protein
MLDAYWEALDFDQPPARDRYRWLAEAIRHVERSARRHHGIYRPLRAPGALSHGVSLCGDAGPPNLQFPIILIRPLQDCEDYHEN